MQKRSAVLVAAMATLAACSNETTSPLAPSVSRLNDASAAPAALTPLTVASFSVTPVMAFGAKKHFFEQEGLAITEKQTPSSPIIFQNLEAGNWHIILTQIDNVFNYRFNASNPDSLIFTNKNGVATFDPVAIGGTDWGNGAKLMLRPDASTCETLRGKNIIVDSPNSGFAFVAYGVLRNKCGFEPNVDYVVRTTGGTPTRFKDLVAGVTTAAYNANTKFFTPKDVPVAGTILNAGFQFRALAAGMVAMGDIPDAATPFMGGSIVVKESWLADHGDVAVRFLRAYAKAQAYVLDPANKAEVLQWLKDDAAKTNAATASFVAQGTYDVLVKDQEGLIPDIGIDRQGLYETIKLRNSFGGFDQPQNLRLLTTPAGGAFNLDYWQDSKDDHKGLGAGRF